ncbi:hypothetical protein MJO29_011919 [Puccinia striiformis f. sp. tritici]|nr:hypothetical protein MJO29_011919 [Puccinia striiformis f. sp. tritici]
MTLPKTCQQQAKVPPKPCQLQAKAPPKPSQPQTKAPPKPSQPQSITAPADTTAKQPSKRRKTNIGSPASPDPTDLPTLAVDDAGDSNHETDDDEDAPMGFRGKGKRARVKPETMATFINKPVKALRACALRKAEYQQLGFKDKLDLDGAFNAYQRAVYLITIKNNLHVKPAWEYLGNQVRICGPTNYNNYCKYNKVAGPIFLDSKPACLRYVIVCVATNKT